MTIQVDCTRAERLAGAIAIGEAGEAEREAYRAHLAGCAHCLHELGGEREIERVMAVATQARDEERWEPDLRRLLSPRRNARWTWGAAFALVAAVVLTVGVRQLERPNGTAQPHPQISAQEARALAAINTQSAPPHEGRAESLVVGDSTTYSAAFDVSVNQHGAPVRCAITRSSGNRLLDESVCRAAMRTHYAAQKRNAR